MLRRLFYVWNQTITLGMARITLSICEEMRNRSLSRESPFRKNVPMDESANSVCTTEESSAVYTMGTTAAIRQMTA